MNDTTKPRLSDIGGNELDGTAVETSRLGAVSRICEAGPVPTFGHAEAVDSGDAVEAGIWIVHLTIEGKPYAFPVLATDERAIELIHEGFILEEVHDMAEAMQAAEAQYRNVQ